MDVQIPMSVVWSVGIVVLFQLIALPAWTWWLCRGRYKPDLTMMDRLDTAYQRVGSMAVEQSKAMSQALSDNREYALKPLARTCDALSDLATSRDVRALPEPAANGRHRIATDLPNMDTATTAHGYIGGSTDE